MTDAFAAGWRAALDAASEMIADIAASAAHGFLFTASSDETETLRKMLDVIALRTLAAWPEPPGLDRHWHDIRGTTTTRLLEAGCTDAEVGAVLGHAVAGGARKAYAQRSRDFALNAMRKWAKEFEERGQVVRLRGA